jgi:putative phosphoesterase
MEKIKLLIISDSHRKSENIEQAIRRVRGCDAVFFLGDGLLDAELASSIHPEYTWYAVRGNCDLCESFANGIAPKTAMTVLCGKRIVYTHGDLYGVKTGLGGLIALARETGADIVLYGHTHERREDYIDGVYYVNPGSIGSYSPSAALLTLGEGEPLFSYLDL